MGGSGLATSRVVRPPSRLVRAYLREVGPGLDVLPWATPVAARRALSVRRRELLVRFEQRVRDSYLSRRPQVSVARALTELGEGDAAALYPGAPLGGPRWFAHTFFDREHAIDGPIRHYDSLASVRLYELDQRDPFAGRPVACAPLFRGATTGNDPGEFVERILLGNDLFDQLRMVLYERGELVMFAGWYRRQREARFDEADHALLLAARPALRAWARTVRAIGVDPLGDGALARTLEALDQPALLVRRRRVVYANSAARSCVARVLEWDRAGRPPGFATVTPLSPGGLPVDLVLPGARPTSSDRFAALPQRLREVARLLGRGRSDKEIACELDMPVTTVRTYVTRVFAKLGVHSRRELM